VKGQGHAWTMWGYRDLLLQCLIILVIFSCLVADVILPTDNLAGCCVLLMPLDVALLISLLRCVKLQCQVDACKTASLASCSSWTAAN